MYDTTIGWRMTNPALAKLYPPISMGETAENVASGSQELSSSAEELSQGSTEQAPRPRPAVPVHLPLREAREQVVNAFEREYIIQKLKETDGNVSRAADAMGVSRQFLHRLMERYDLRRTDAKSTDPRGG